jgi:cysteine synthase
MTGVLETRRPLLPPIEDRNFTELQHRIDDRMRGVLGEYDIAPEKTLAFDLDGEELFARTESLISNTPLIHVEDVNGAHILAKVESQNPTENHYDRAYPRTIKRLQDDKVIEPGDELIECTSGSAGRAFAWAAQVLGYRSRILVPPELPKARLQDMINFGAEIEVTDPGYMKAVSKAYVARIKKLQSAGLVDKHETPDYMVFAGIDESGQRVCFVNHSANEITIEGFDGIGNEIAEQMPADQKVDFLISVMGNGTSTTALARTIRQHYPGVQVIGLEDEGSPYYFEQKYPGEYERRFGRAPEFTQHDMFGSSAFGIRLKYGNADMVDEVWLSNSTVRNEARDVHNKDRKGYEQIGNSSAASLVVARQLAAQNPDSNIVIIFYDKADQYGESPVIASQVRFLYDRIRPVGVPPRNWKQQQVGSIALMPQSTEQAYAL